MVNNLRVVVVAAGSSKRMGSGINKQYILLKDKPVLSYCIEVLEKSPLVQNIVIVAHEKEVEYCKIEVIEKYGYQKVSKVIAGGPERQDSVYLGLKELEEDTQWVAVHDGARPFLTLELLQNLAEAVEVHGAVIPGVMPKDTLKTVNKEGLVVETLERSAITAVQTPQVFACPKLMRAYEHALQDNFYGTDDAALFERYAGQVKVIAGELKNIKITQPEDLIWAEAILNSIHITG